MSKSVQIETLMNAATQYLVGTTRHRPLAERQARVDAALSRFHIFTESSIAERVIEAVDGPGPDANTKVSVTIEVVLSAPDGSFSTTRSCGRGSGDLANATTDAAEQAQWLALSKCLCVSPVDDGN